MNSERYDYLVDAACKLAGRGDGDWNTKFREALRHLGLALTPRPTSGSQYPNGEAYQAPHPFGITDTWETPMYLVFKEDLSHDMELIK